MEEKPPSSPGAPARLRKDRKSVRKTGEYARVSWTALRLWQRGNFIFTERAGEGSLQHWDITCSFEVLISGSGSTRSIPCGHRSCAAPTAKWRPPMAARERTDRGDLRACDRRCGRV